jgi:protoporphyrinogen oxidase
MGGLPEALSGHADIRLEAPVLHIGRRGDPGPYEIQVGGKRPSSHLAEAVILAIPYPLIPGMVDQLPDDFSEYCRQIPYSPSIVVALAAEGQAESRAMINNLVRSDFKTLGTVVCDRHKSPLRVPEGKELFTAILREEASRALFHEPDERICSDVLKEMDRFLPKFSSKLLFARIHRWERGALQMPAGQMVKRAGVLRYLEKGIGNLFFAGEGFPVSSLEGSFLSGIRAAEQVIARNSRAA